MNSQTRMYVMTHKDFQHPNMEGFFPLQVGSALHEDLGYLWDDTCDNISDLNPYYGELTGQYWVWKNDHDTQNIGCCHYRRYFLNSQKQLMSIDELEDELSNTDILAACIEDPRTWRELYGAGHNINDLLAMGAVLQENEPDAFALFEQLLDSHTICFGNMYAMPKRIFDEYMEWLFPILLETGERIDISGYDAYEKRVFGLLSENMIQIFANTRGYKLTSGKVAIIAEKAETTELKQAIAQLVKEDKIKEAVELFEQYCTYRKDVLFSQSDVSRELPLIGKLLKVMEQEKAAGSGIYYGKSDDIKVLLNMFKTEQERH
jgi:hypothetical protein